jgi:hypothetical protein
MKLESKRDLMVYVCGILGRDGSDELALAIIQDQGWDYVSTDTDDVDATDILEIAHRVVTL